MANVKHMGMMGPNSGMPNTEIQKRLRKLEKGSGESKSLVTNVGDNTYEWTDEYTYIAYASTISNASSEGIITSQQDATDFSFSAISETGVILSWLGYWTSKSLQQSGDPSDYIWTDLTAESPASSVAKYYTESTNLLTNIGDPYNLVSGVPWISFSGSIPASAFWVATQYTINGVQTPWRIVPVRTKQNDLGLIVYTISGRDKPTMNNSVWKADAITAISTFTGNTYSTTNEMGFGTVIGITYDDGKLFGTLKKVSGVATWVTTSTFVDGELLITETVVADKIAANAITASKLSIVGTDDVRTITGSIAGQESAQATADGEIIGFFQTTAPTVTVPAAAGDPSFGDIWIDITGGAPLDPDTDIRRYQDSNGGSAGSLSWVVTTKSAIGVIYLNSYQATADIAANKTTYDTYVAATILDLSAIQSQVDGSITTHFLSGAPTLSNAPYSAWTTDALKVQHLADLYYDTATGYAYRFAYEDIVDDPDAGVIYSWIRITDTDVTLALSNASIAQDTADGKRRVFVVTPTPPYDVGDLWAQGSSGDIKKCATAKAAGTSYAGGDWVVASKYTDNTIANLAQITADGAIRGFFATTAPAANVSSFGDIWIDTDATVNDLLTAASIYRYEDTATPPGSQGTLDWRLAPTNALGLIYLDAYTAQARADLGVADALAAKNVADDAKDDLDDIADDTKITPLEKEIAVSLWNAISGEYAGIVASSTNAGTSSATYTTVYNALNVYLNQAIAPIGLLVNRTTTETIVRATWETNWSDYYNGKQALLDTISAALKTIGDDAQITADGEIVSYFRTDAPTVANSDPDPSFGDIWIDTDALVNGLLTVASIYRYQDTATPPGSQGTLGWYAAPDSAIGKIYLDAYAAQNTANSKIKTFYQGLTTDGIPVSISAGDFWADEDNDNKLYRAEIVGADAITAGEWVSVQDATIATAQAAAVAADGKAVAAQGDATAAQGELDNISADNIVAPSEKLQAKALWDAVYAEKPGIIESAANASVASTSYIAEYDALNSYLNNTENVFSSMGTNTTLTPSGEITIGTPNTFNSATTKGTSVAFDPNTAGKFVVVYEDDANSDYGTAVVGTVSGTTISYGSEYNFDTGDVSIDSINVAFDPNVADKFVIVWDDNSANKGKAIVGTISGTVISFGSEYTFNTSYSSYITVAFDPNASNKFVIAWQDGSGGNGSAIVGTISGTVISFGSEYIFHLESTNSTDARDISLAFDPNTTGKFVVTYREYLNTSTSSGTAVVGTISGTALSFGSQYKFVNNSGNGHINDTSVAFDPNAAGKFVIAYSEDDPGGDGKAIVGTISGTAISYGSIYTFNTTNSNETLYNTEIVFDPNWTNTFVISYKKQAYARLARGTLLGTVISFEDFTTSIQATYNAIAFDPNTRTRFIISYKDNSTTHGKAVIGLNGMGTRELWDNKWVLYYTAKQTLLDAIAAKLKTLADTAQEAASDIADNIYVSNTTTIDGGTIAAGTKITAGSNNNVGVLDGADSTYRIYAGHATAASAPFRVSQTGAVTIDSGGTDRLVLSNNKIEVYDGGILRVKLGYLGP